MRRSEETNRSSSGGGMTPMPHIGSQAAWRGEVRMREPMSKHTSWRAGGIAERFYIPANMNDLSLFLHALPMSEPVYMIGLGSNLLVRDGGLRGTVVLMHGALSRICLEQRKRGLAVDTQTDASTQLVYAEAGVPSPKVARFAAKHGLEGAEFLAGIPGTVGGALAMNAGCYGRETWDIVTQVMTIDRLGNLHERLPEDYDIGYRHVAGRVHEPASYPLKEWFVAAWFRLPRGDGAASLVKIKELLQKRIATQPLGTPNAGSVFRNPPGDHAARLIEASGLKGYTIGGAMVSPKHANFIVNAGGATAKDIESLIEFVQDTVHRKQGIQLEREVRIVGEEK